MVFVLRDATVGSEYGLLSLVCGKYIVALLVKFSN
jgi:hypothetical protein